LREPKASYGSTKSKGEKDKAKFGLFKKCTTLEPISCSSSDYFPAHHHAAEHNATENGRHDPPQSDSQSAQYQRIRAILDTLISQHDTLLKSLQGISSLDGQGLHVSTVPETVEEEDHKSEGHTPSPTLSRNRHSIATTMSDSASEWFDASEGAEEFVLDDVIPDANEQPSYIMTNDSASSTSLEPDAESVDTDIESEELPAPVSDDAPASPDTPLQVARRTHLPAPITGDEGSLFTVLKKNVGKVCNSFLYRTVLIGSC